MKPTDLARALDAIAGTKFATAIHHALNVAESVAIQYVQQTNRFQNRTGRLRASFGRLGSGILTREVGSNVPYAPFVEFGTRFIRPRRFAAMAALAAENELRAAIERRMHALFG